MKELAKFALAFAAGYLLVTKLAPALQARYEALDLDSTWEVWDTEDWM